MDIITNNNVVVPPVVKYDTRQVEQATVSRSMPSGDGSVPQTQVKSEEGYST